MAVVVGASAGGVEALCRLVAGLPRELPAAVLVVLHVSPSAASVLPAILHRCGPLPASHPRDGDTLQPGCIYVAPPDHHLLIEGRQARLWRGPRENGVRPAIDPLFRSAAAEYGAGAIGVVLSGMLDDGTAGLIELQRAGGMALVQDPGDSSFPSMPASAARFASPDHVAPAEELAGLVQQAATRLAHPHQPLASSPTAFDQPVTGNPGHSDPPSEGTAMSADETPATVHNPTAMSSDETPDTAHNPNDPADDAGVTSSSASAAEQPGTVSAFTCPECGGTLWERHHGDFLQFRCRVGHAYGADSLDAAQLESLEQSLWAAVVALEERADLCLQLAERMRLKGVGRVARRYELQADDARRRTHVVRQAITKLSEPAADDHSVNLTAVDEAAPETSHG